MNISLCDYWYLFHFLLLSSAPTEPELSTVKHKSHVEKRQTMFYALQWPCTGISAASTGLIVAAVTLYCIRLSLVDPLVFMRGRGVLL